MRADFEQLINNVNDIYDSPGQPGYTTTCGGPWAVQSTRIRFEINEIYFLDSDVWNSDATGAHLADILEYLFVNYPGSEKAMNHVFTQPGTWPGQYWGYYSYGTIPSYGQHSYVFTRNSMWGASPLFHDHVNHLIHEYGHALGLHHTYDGPEAGSGRPVTHYDFLDDVFGTCAEPAMYNPASPCYNGCSPTPGYVCRLTSCFFDQFPPYRPLMTSGDNTNFISRKQAGRMHRALSLYDNSFTTNNKPMHQYVKEKHSLDTYWLMEDETWDFAIKMYNDIIVTAGKTLTIKCEVRMPIDGVIEVRPGGRLILDGGKVTCAHPGEQWHGIVADGTSNQHQEPANNPTFQGLVIMKNGAVVEHARIGFSNYRYGSPSTYNGGVLQVQGNLLGIGAHFKNCTVGADFRKYRNFYPSSPSHTKNDNSYFRHAIFEVDYHYRGDVPFEAHVKMQEVRGIPFAQCDFINSQTTESQDGHTSSDLGVGIFSRDATYSVTAMCAQSLPLCEYGSGVPEPVCPENLLKPSRFIGLDHGIRAMSAGIGGYAYTVKDALFENNVCGVYNEGVDNTKILRSKFKVGGRDVDLDENGLDLHLDGFHRAIFVTGSNGFRLEQNEMRQAAVVHAGTEGIVVSSTGPANEQVYKNISSDLDYAYVAEESCVDVLHPTTTGLAFLCNVNQDNGQEDFKVRSKLPVNDASFSIKAFQGSVSKSAGNSFTPQQNGGSPYFSFHNETEQLPITYFWDTQAHHKPLGYNAPWVMENPLPSPINGCPTRITCGGPVVVKKPVLLGLMEQERTAYLNLKYVYESLLDGGDFEELKCTIMESWPADAWELRNELIAKSPYLSTEILKEAAKKNVLPHAMYLEVCLANPEATQREGFLKWVQYEAPNPLPEYMLAQIVASWDQKTWRSSLESDMGWYLGEYQRLNNELITDMLADSTAQPVDSIRARLQLDPGLRARFAEVALLLGEGNYGEAKDLLDGLDESYPGLERQGLQDRNDLLELINLLQGLGERSTAEMDVAERDALKAIADRQPSVGASYARGILCYDFGICDPVWTGGTRRPKMHLVGRPGADAAGQAPSLVVHPNPANTWVAFSHDLDGRLDHAAIVVRDAQGKVIHEMELRSSPGQLVWDTRGQANGTYMVELRNAGKLIEAQRAIIQQ